MDVITKIAAPTRTGQAESGPNANESHSKTPDLKEARSEPVQARTP
jgi:hypothetical protein